MLLELAITDFAIIDELRLPFEPGLNALTGETGAGKSILIDALGAVLGERTGPDVVRTGARGARVEATFDVADLLEREAVAATLADVGIEPEDGLLILTREISATGRGAARINGRASTAGTLARIGALMVDIHGQSEHLSLLRPAEHLDILDRYAGLLQTREELAGQVAALREVRARIAAIVGGARERAQRADLLRFQVEEIEEAALEPGEDERLQAERAVLANAERLMLDAAAAHALLAGDDDAVGPNGGPLAALVALRQAASHLTEIASLDPSATSLADRLAEVVYLLEDVAAETRDYRDRIEADPARLVEVDDRLDEIKRLLRKYGATIDEVIDFGASASRELETLTGDEADVEMLRATEADLLRSVGERAAALSVARVEAGERLGRAVEASIAELNMGRAEFALAITQRDDPEGVEFDGRRVAVDETGVDRVEFFIAPNAGEALKPLGRVASGGETARLMLALKSILSAADSTPTLVFDEIDVGVGGRSGQVVGEKLWRLADRHQVLVITHLPQIAAFAPAHFRIAKLERGGRVVSSVEALSGRARVDELAAMLDGVPITAASRANAEAMLRRVEGWKRAEVDDGSAESGIASVDPSAQMPLPA